MRQVVLCIQDAMFLDAERLALSLSRLGWKDAELLKFLERLAPLNAILAAFIEAHLAPFSPP
jgi:hypothetical protein